MTHDKPGTGVHADTIAQAWNWGRWSNSNGPGPGRCASAEGGYVTPRPDSEQLAASVNRVDVLAAERFERAVVSLPTAAERRLMLLLYVRGMREAEVARKLRMHIHDFIALQWRLLDSVAARLVRERDVELIRTGKAHWAGLTRRQAGISVSHTIRPRAQRE